MDIECSLAESVAFAEGFLDGIEGVFGFLCSDPRFFLGLG